MTIQLNHLSIHKDNYHIFEDINLTLEYGKSYALIGTSGCGKSTLLNTIAGIDKVDKEQIVFDGQIQKFNAKFYREQLGYLFQNYGLVDNLSIDENLDIGLAYKKLSKREKEALKSKYLSQFGLTENKKRKVHTLSGGEQQRVALIRLMLKEPSIILADEPTGALDPETGKLIIQLLLNLVDKNNILIMATHDMNIASQCDEVIDLTKLA